MLAQKGADMRVVLRTLIATALLAAFRFSPWPSVLMIRHLFDSEAAKAMAALQPLVPPGCKNGRIFPIRPMTPTPGLT
jgi:hypothetical protein